MRGKIIKRKRSMKLEWRIIAIKEHSSSTCRMYRMSWLISLSVSEFMLFFPTEASAHGFAAALYGTSDKADFISSYIYDAYACIDIESKTRAYPFTLYTLFVFTSVTAASFSNNCKILIHSHTQTSLHTDVLSS